MAKQVTILGRDDVHKLLEADEEIKAYVTVTLTVNYDTEVFLGKDDLKKLLAISDGDAFEDALKDIASDGIDPDDVMATVEISLDGVVVNDLEAELYPDDPENEDEEDDEDKPA